jgi:hypothetical protein
MLALRRLYADEVRKSSLHTMRDDVVLAQLADLIAAGALKVSLVRTPERGAPVEEGATETMYFFPTGEAECVAYHGALVDAAWDKLCRIAALPEVREIVPTWYE